MPKKLLNVDDFVARLRTIESGLITRDNVLDLCETVQITDRSLRPYLFFEDARYTRNLIYRDDMFEVMAICWSPNQRTAVHTHNGQLCWMVPQRGALRVVDYKWLGCDHPENQNVVGMDCLAGSDGIELHRLHEAHAVAGGPVLTADKLQTIHQLFNEDEESVSIHVYSRPIDSCVAFDMQQRSCYRRELDYYTKYGERERRTLPILGANR